MILAKFTARQPDGSWFKREAYVPQVPAVGERVSFDQNKLCDLTVMAVNWDLAEHDDPPLGGAPTVANISLEPIR